MNKSKIHWPLILILAAAKFLLPFLLQHPMYELQRDEYLYYQQGLHLSLGYLENPPLLSWLGTVSSWFGGSEVSLKFWPSLFGAATVIITCMTVAELGGRSLAQLLAALGVMGGAFVRVHFLFQPNFLDIFFWTLSLYFLIRYINSNRQKFIFWLAVSLALGWWSKYSVLFMAMAIVIGLVLSQYRYVFAKRKTWLAALLALVMILPNVLWQYSHNWPLVHHMNELRDTQLKYIDKSDFIKSQFMMLLPAALLWIAGLIWVSGRNQWRIIGIIYLSVILLLLFGSGKSYYALGVYPVLIAAGAVAWEHILGKRKWIGYAFASLMIIFNWLIMPLLLPTRTPEQLDAFYKKAGIKHKWEDLNEHPLPQDFADMLGWKELAAKTDKAYHNIDGVHNMLATAIYCRNYGQAGSIKYYNYRKENSDRWVISDNGSFLLWIPDGDFFKNILFVGRQMPGKDDEVFRHFEKVRVIDSVTNPYSRQFGDKIIFFENIDSAGSKLVAETLKEMKAVFNR